MKLKNRFDEKLGQYIAVPSEMDVVVSGCLTHGSRPLLWLTAILRAHRRSAGIDQWWTSSPHIVITCSFLAEWHIHPQLMWAQRVHENTCDIESSHRARAAVKVTRLEIRLQ